MAEEKLMKPNSLFHRVWIDGICKIQFEIVGGENFSIVSPSEIIANVTEILSRSKDRVGCGFSADVLTRCTGGKDKLFEDNIRIGIQSGSQSFHFMLPIASPSCPTKTGKCCVHAMFLFWRILGIQSLSVITFTNTRFSTVGTWKRYRI